LLLFDKDESSTEEESVASAKKNEQKVGNETNRFHESSNHNDEEHEHNNFHGSKNDSILDTDGEFIQPEGKKAAEELPSDVWDATRSIPYDKLPTFFNNLVEEIENEKIPRISKIFDSFEKKVNNAMNIRRGIVVSQEVDADGGKKNNDLDDLECQGDALYYDEILNALIRDGTDQCRLALKRLSSRKSYKQALLSINSNNEKELISTRAELRRKCGRTAREAMDIRLDRTDDLVENIVKKARNLLNALVTFQHQYGLEDNNNDSMPTNDITEKYDDDSEKSDDVVDERLFVNQEINNFFAKPGQNETVFQNVQHMHASTTRKNVDERYRPNRKRRRGDEKRRKNVVPAFSKNNGRSQNLLNFEEDAQSRQEESSDASNSVHTNEIGDNVSSHAKVHFQNDIKVTRRLKTKMKEKIRKISRKLGAKDSCREETLIYTKAITHGAGITQSLINSYVKNTNSSNVNTAQESKSLGPTHDLDHGRSFDNSLRLGPTASDFLVCEDALCHEVEADIISDKSDNFSSSPNTSMSIDKMFDDLTTNVNGLPESIDELESKEELQSMLSFLYDIIEIFSGKLSISSIESTLKIKTKKLFDSFLYLLNNHFMGMSILESLLISARKNVSDWALLHVRLLRCIVLLIGTKIQSYLKEEDGLSFLLFCHKRSVLVDIIIIQILDVCFSQLLPSSWCLSISTSTSIISAEIWGELSLLLNGLGEHVHLVESVARLLTSSLECQEWRSSRKYLNKEGHGTLFVSSIDPARLEAFWSGNGDYFLGRNQKMTRLDALAKIYPRCEVNAIWSSFTFFANVKKTTMISNKIVDEMKDLRWNLISTLFFTETGTLSCMFPAPLNGADNPSPLHISSNHRNLCVKELCNFSKLLKSEALDPIPNINELLQKIIVKAVCIEAQSDQLSFINYSSNDDRDEVNNSYMGKFLRRHDLKLVLELWVESDHATYESVCNIDETELDKKKKINDMASRLLDEYITCDSQDHIRSILSLHSTSKILRASMDLLEAWNSRFGMKMDRWLSMKNTTEAIIRGFLQKSEIHQVLLSKKKQGLKNDMNICLSHDGKGFDAFTDAFPAQNEIRCKNLKSATRDINESKRNIFGWALYREAAASIMIASTLSWERHAPAAIKEKNKSPLGTFDKEWYNKLWEILSNDCTRERQKYLFSNFTQENVPGQMSIESSYCLLLLHFNSTKLMTLVTLLHLDEASSKQSNCRDESQLLFLITSILASVESICEMLRLANIQEQKTEHIRYSNLNEDFPGSVECTNALTCGCVWISSVINRCRFMLISFKRIASGPNNIYPTIMKFANHSLNLFVPLGMRILEEITQSMNLYTTSDACMRACLSFLRSAIGLKQISSEQISMTSCLKNATSNSEIAKNKANFDSQSYQSSALSEDIFGGIDDTALMNIDLEIITPVSQNKYFQKTFQIQNQENEQNLVKNPHSDIDFISSNSLCKNLWKCITRALQNSILSSTYFDLNQLSHDALKLECFGFHGKNLCRRHAGGLCSLLAYLCTLGKAANPTLSSLQQSLFNIPTTSSGQVVSEMTDMKHLCHCFTTELCRYATSFKSCELILCKNMDLAFWYLMEIIIDANTLNEFPTLNISQLSQIGGQECAIKERARLHEIQKKYETSKFSNLNPDSEAVGIRKLLKGDMVDLPGPFFMCSRVWSFCQNLGKVMIQSEVNGDTEETNKNIFSRIGNTLLQIQPMESTRSSLRASNAIQPISLERECMKRFNIICSLLKVVLIHEDLAPLKLDKHDILAMLVNILLEEIESISSGLLYLQKNLQPGDMYYLSKSHILHKTYIEFVISILTWLLREIPLVGFKNEKLSAFIWENIISSSLVSSKKTEGLNLHETRSYLGRFLSDNSILLNKYNISSKFQSNLSLDKIKIPHLNFFHSTSRRIRELILYAGLDRRGAKAIVEPSNIYHTILEAAVSSYDKETNNKDNNVLISTIISVILNDNTKSSRSSSGDLFECALDKCIPMQSSILYTKREESELHAIKKFRSYAFNDFFTPKLKFPRYPQKKKLAILQIIEKTLLTANEKKNTSLTIHVIPNRSISNFSLSLEEDVCQIFCGLLATLNSELITNGNLEWIMSKIFSCFRRFLEIEVHGKSMKLLRWCKSNSKDNVYAAYVDNVLKFMIESARLLLGGRCRNFLQSFYEVETRLYNGINDFKSLSETFNNWALGIFSKYTNKWLHLRIQRLTLEEKLFSNLTGLEIRGISITNTYTKMNLKPSSSISFSTDFDASWTTFATEYIDAYLRN